MKSYEDEIKEFMNDQDYNPEGPEGPDDPILFPNTKSVPQNIVEGDDIAIPCVPKEPGLKDYKVEVKGIIDKEKIPMPPDVDKINKTSAMWKDWPTSTYFSAQKKYNEQKNGIHENTPEEQEKIMKKFQTEIDNSGNSAPVNKSLSDWEIKSFIQKIKNAVDIQTFQKIVEGIEETQLDADIEGWDEEKQPIATKIVDQIKKNVDEEAMKHLLFGPYPIEEKGYGEKPFQEGQFTKPMFFSPIGTPQNWKTTSSSGPQPSINDYTKSYPYPSSGGSGDPEEIDPDMPKTMDEEAYAKEYGHKINCGINYSLGYHTKKYVNDNALAVCSFLKSATVWDRVRIDPNEYVFKDAQGKWFLVSLEFHPIKYNSDECHIVYNFSENIVLRVVNTIPTEDETIDEVSLGFRVNKGLTPELKKMDILDWMIVRKAIYFERFPDKANIKDVYDPAILSLSSLFPDTGIPTLEDFSKIKDQNGEYDLIDLDD